MLWFMLKLGLETGDQFISARISVDVGILVSLWLTSGEEQCRDKSSCGVSGKPVLSWVAELLALGQVIVLKDH